MNEYKLYINGKWTETVSGEVKDDINPADGSVWAKVHTAGEKETNAAIEAAVAAFPEWADVMPDVREKYLLKAADYMEANLEKFGQMLIDESGSTSNLTNQFMALSIAISEVLDRLGIKFELDLTAKFIYDE